VGSLIHGAIESSCRGWNAWFADVTSDWSAKAHSLTLMNVFRENVYRIPLFVFPDNDSFVGEALLLMHYMHLGSSRQRDVFEPVDHSIDDLEDRMIPSQTHICSATDIFEFPSWLLRECHRAAVAIVEWCPTRQGWYVRRLSQ
jgi:hypothetical protein